jgi:hypothetical protein
MAWSWSHSAEAYADAEKNLADESDGWLATALAEFRFHDDEETVPYLSPISEVLLNGYTRQALEQYGKDELVDLVWEKASEQRICDNGGFNAWMCPYGCHTVPFDRDENEDERWVREGGPKEALQG